MMVPFLIKYPLEATKPHITDTSSVLFDNSHTKSIMIRKILSLPTLALCFTLGSALFAGCNEDYIKNTETKVRWSNVKNPKYGDPINTTLKA